MAAKPPKTYFAEQLAGEKPLAQRTASNLCSLAADILDMEPWLDLQEVNLIAVRANERAEPDFLSVLGSLGEHRAVHVYPGVAGYAWYQEVLAAKDPKRLMLADCEALHVAYPEPSEITDLDMDLIRGCRFGPYARAFQFRSMRRGHFPWYINDDEGKKLATCLEGLLALLDSDVFSAHGSGMWIRGEPTVPMLTRVKGRWNLDPLKTEVARVVLPHLWLDPDELADLKSHSRSGVVCIGDCILPGAAGLKNERPIVLNLVAALDARSGYAYPPCMRKPGEPLPAAAARALAEAIRARGALPERVLATDEQIARGLEELGRELGFEIRLKSHIPVLDEFFHVIEKKARADAGRGPELVM